MPVDGLQHAHPSGSASPPAAVGSVAVLPFVDMSEEHALEYFCDGIAEEITDALTHVPGLHVAARTSAFSYKGKEIDLRAVGRELGVDGVLEGSVRLSGQHLRVTAQLIDVARGWHLWSERYDRTMSDVLEVQEDIARSVMARVHATVPEARGSASPARPSARSHSSDPEAYRLYLLGRHSWRRRDSAGMEKGVRAFLEAVERDPGYALPWAGLADAYGTLAFYSLMTAEEARSRSDAAIGRALELCLAEPEVQHALAMNRYWLHWDFEGAERGWREAMRLDPQAGISAAYLSQMHGVLGHAERASEWAERARAMEPLSPLVLSVAGSALHMAGYHARGAEMAREALELEEDDLLATFVLALNLMGSDQEERAEVLFRRAVERSGRNSFLVSLHAWALAELGRADEAWQLRHEIEERVPAGTASWSDLGGARAALWDLEGALAAFGESVAEREVRALYLRRALPYRMLAEIPRFLEICAAIGT